MLSLLVDLAVSLTHPPRLSLCLLICAGLGLLLRRRGIAATLFVAALAWSSMWSIPQVSDWLRGRLESRYPPVAAASLPKTDAIVVLGGGHYGWLERPGIQLEQLESSRVAAGARAWLAGRAPLVVLTGGGAPGKTEAGRMAAAITRLGVADSALVLEQRSRSTRDNAQFTAALVKPRGVRTILLVTSSIHMPRAVLLFREAGFHVVPVSVPERAERSRWSDRWLPSRNALWRSGRAMKEFAALAVAHLQSDTGAAM
jgi:uncharacterized SAM-binding protein YcdF (DUF218 family)